MPAEPVPIGEASSSDEEDLLAQVKRMARTLVMSTLSRGIPRSKAHAQATLRLLRYMQRSSEAMAKKARQDKPNSSLLPRQYDTFVHKGLRTFLHFYQVQIVYNTSPARQRCRVMHLVTHEIGRP